MYELHVVFADQTKNN